MVLEVIKQLIYEISRLTDSCTQIHNKATRHLHLQFYFTYNGLKYSLSGFLGFLYLLIPIHQQLNCRHLSTAFYYLLLSTTPTTLKYTLLLIDIMLNTINNVTRIKIVALLLREG